MKKYTSSQISTFCRSLLKCCQNLRNRIEMLLNLPRCWPNCGRSLPKFVQFLRKLRKRIRLQQVAVPRNILKLCTRRMRILSAHATALSLRSRSRLSRSGSEDHVPSCAGLVPGHRPPLAVLGCLILNCGRGGEGDQFQPIRRFFLTLFIL